MDLQELLLSWILAYGAPLVALLLFLCGAGIPVPGIVVVIASGAFVRLGHLPGPTTFVLALIGVVAGDTLSFLIGKALSGPIERRFGKRRAWLRAKSFFEKRGGGAIYFTRWLFAPLAVPTNWVAGGSGYPTWRFVMWDILGEITWLLLLGALGYAFGSQWELISTFVSQFTGVAVGLLLVIVGIYLYHRLFRAAKRKRREALEDSAELENVEDAEPQQIESA